MKFVFYTNSVSPHQLPLANEMVKMLGVDDYRYVYTCELSQERKRLGWGDGGNDEWCKQGSVDSDMLKEADVLLSGLRAINLFERRKDDGKPTIYCSERWFKPAVGILRLLSLSYFRMARRFVRLLSSNADFYYYPMGIHAGRDMAQLCGLMHGDWRCLFSAPELDYERKPGGRIWLKKGGADKRYCLHKMRMWGYFVDSSKFRVESLELGEGSLEFGVESLELRDRGRGADKIRVLWVGRLLKLKRVDTIIRAVGECMERRQADSSLPEITLDVYGMGPEETRIRKIAAKYGDLIRFHPPVPIEEVRNLMRKHDVYVLSSNAYEGWGAVVSEALEENIKVVGTYEAGASATVLPESNLYPAGDSMKLADILVSDVKRTGIGAWTAKSAARALLSLCGSGQSGEMQ